MSTCTNWPDLPPALAAALEKAQDSVGPIGKAKNDDNQERAYVYFPAEPVMAAWKKASRANGLRLRWSGQVMVDLNGLHVARRFARLDHKPSGDSVNLGSFDWPLPRRQDIDASQSMSTALTMMQARAVRDLLEMEGAGAASEESDAPRKSVPTGPSGVAPSTDADYAKRVKRNSYRPPSAGRPEKVSQEKQASELADMAEQMDGVIASSKVPPAHVDAEPEMRPHSAGPDLEAAALEVAAHTQRLIDEEAGRITPPDSSAAPGSLLGVASSTDSRPTVDGLPASQSTSPSTSPGEVSHKTEEPSKTLPAEKSAEEGVAPSTVTGPAPRSPHSAPVGGALPSSGTTDAPPEVLLPLHSSASLASTEGPAAAIPAGPSGGGVCRGCGREECAGCTLVQPTPAEVEVVGSVATKFLTESGTGDLIGAEKPAESAPLWPHKERGAWTARRIRKAKKDFKCSKCAGTIPKGSDHKDGGKKRLCLECYGEMGGVVPGPGAGEKGAA